MDSDLTLARFSRFWKELEHFEDLHTGLRAATLILFMGLCPVSCVRREGERGVIVLGWCQLACLGQRAGELGLRGPH